jgi:U2 small nuclear ribonucleoprotein B''
LKNLPEKINKNDLKRELYMLFSTYGPVLDIVTMRDKMRGQAHVVYRDVQTSTQAMRALQNFEFLGKEMQIMYGKGQSQIIPKLRGAFEPPATAQTASEATDLQRSIFNAPPSSIPAKLAVVNGLKPNETGLPPPPQGVKRPREEEDAAEESDAPMEEDDDDAPMEDSDSD